MAQPIQIGVPMTSWDVGDMLAGSSQGRAVRVPGSISPELMVFAQKGDGKKSSVPFWTSVGSIIPGLAAIATSGSANDLIAGTIPPLRFPALTGDVTTPRGSLATTISPNAVSNGKLAKMPPMTIKGNNSILDADPKDLTVAEVNAMGIGGGGGGSGTVTSVGLSMPTIFSVAGSPVTAAGTFTVTLANEAANTVWAGPATGAPATPTFRALVIADIPSLATLYQPIDATLTALSALADAVGFLHNDGAGNLTWAAAGTGTVTSVSVVSANGFAGTVATATTTPAITLSTSITGVLKGNGTALSAAVAATDYVAPGAITADGITMSTARLLGRTTAGTGAIEEITVGSGLTLSAGALTATGGTGDFVGPASATDNAVVRFDGTTGKLGQNSLFIVDDSGNVSDGGTLPANTALYFERTGFAIATLNSTGQDARLRLQRADNTKSAWLEFIRNDNGTEWLMGAPWNGTTPSGTEFTIDYWDGSVEHPFFLLSTAGALKFNAYTTAGLLSNDASGNVTTATVGSGLSLSAGVLSATGGGGTPAGSNTQIQFNNSGAFGASADLTWGGSTSGLTVSGNPLAGTNPTFKITDSNANEPVWMRVEQSNISAAFELGVAGAAGQFLTDAHAGDGIFKGFGAGGPGMAIGGGPTSPATSLYIKYVSGSKGRVIVGGVTDDGANDLQVLDNAFIKNSLTIGNGLGAGPFLKINSSTYTLLQYARGGASKFSTGTANAANDFITGTVQDDMAFKSDASKSIVFSTDNGTSILMKLIAGQGGIFLGDQSGTPSTPTGGGVLFVSSGALKWIGSSGTITTIAAA